MRTFLALTCLGIVASLSWAAEPGTHLIGHRGLIHHAPENTLATFGACIDLRVGFELDVRRTRDGHLVCLHDADVKRTTDGNGAVLDLTLADLKKLDAGSWLDPVFQGERVPTLDEVFALFRARKSAVLIAVDVKTDDDKVEADIVSLARKHQVLGQLVCIGRTIDQPAVRQRFRAADGKIGVAALAQKAEDWEAALADQHANWAYVRFVPTAAQVEQARRAGKRVFLAGPTVVGQEPDNWRRAADAGVDAVLTDFPLEARQALRRAK